MIKKKTQLIEDVFENLVPIHQSAIDLGLKYSSAKAIIKKYREFNTLERKPRKKRVQ